MRLAKLIGERIKEKPADALLQSHILLIRGGYIRQVAQGIYTLLLPARRLARNIEQIIRQEMDRLDGQEVLFPVVLPADLWQESGRFDTVGSELVRFKDRSGRILVLGMTHEEAAVHLARSEARSYAQYPFMIYQIQTKFRDEPRSRGGLVRVREFTMKDAYSFHRTEACCAETYAEMRRAYHHIFARAGLSVVDVQSDTGMMGGRIAHEFMYLSDQGEDTLISCPACGYHANLEVAVSAGPPPAPAEKDAAPADQIRLVATPDVCSIDDLCAYLGIPAAQTIKAAVFSRADNRQTVLVFLRGDRRVNESKLSKLLQTDLVPLEQEQAGALCLGFVGPYLLEAGLGLCLYDQSLTGCTGMVCGANQTDHHLTGIDVRRDLAIDSFADLAQVEAGDACASCGQMLAVRRGIEVGNIFQLGTRYAQSMGLTYTDEQGQAQVPCMGCYGIGIGRLLACILEAHCSDRGPVWPFAVAPWLYHICLINNKDPDVWAAGDALYQALNQADLALLDDRPVSAGIQFADADLLGAPIRVIVGKRHLQNGQVEVMNRVTGTSSLVALAQAADYCRGMSQI